MRTRTRFTLLLVGAFLLSIPWPPVLFGPGNPEEAALPGWVIYVLLSFLCLPGLLVVLLDRTWHAFGPDAPADGK